MQPLRQNFQKTAPALVPGLFVPKDIETEVSREDRMEFPALYKDADEASNRAQSEFLNLVRAEYTLLIVAAILSMEPFKDTASLIFYALIFIVSLVIMLLRLLRKPDQDL